MSNERFIVLFVKKNEKFRVKKIKNLCTPKIQKGGYYRECCFSIQQRSFSFTFLKMIIYDQKKKMGWIETENEKKNQQRIVICKIDFISRSTL